jgi:hypothetical protein
MRILAVLGTITLLLVAETRSASAQHLLTYHGAVLGGPNWDTFPWVLATNVAAHPPQGIC